VMANILKVNSRLVSPYVRFISDTLLTKLDNKLHNSHKILVLHTIIQSINQSFIYLLKSNNE